MAFVETRNHLGMLLETPLLLWSETSQDYAQKTVQNLELARETMKEPQPPKFAQNLVKWL